MSQLSGVNLKWRSTPTERIDFYASTLVSGILTTSGMDLWESMRDFLLVSIASKWRLMPTSRCPPGGQRADTPVPLGPNTLRRSAADRAAPTGFSTNSTVTHTYGDANIHTYGSANSTNNARLQGDSYGATINWPHVLIVMLAEASDGNAYLIACDRAWACI